MLHWLWWRWVQLGWNLGNPKVTQTIEQNEACYTCNVKITIVHVFKWWKSYQSLSHTSCSYDSCVIFGCFLCQFHEEQLRFIFEVHLQLKSCQAPTDQCRPMAQVNPPLLSPRCGFDKKDGPIAYFFWSFGIYFSISFMFMIGVSLWFQLELQKFQWAAWTIHKQCVSEGWKGERVKAFSTSIHSCQNNLVSSCIISEWKESILEPTKQVFGCFWTGDDAGRQMLLLNPRWDGEATS